ncbi:MAG TPA: farnesyl diphosphate synthase [Myxococcales bacterium]|nr:farnesyl diphosphate synthase [Myxococcales bacterium]
MKSNSEFRLDHYLEVQRARVELLLQKRLEGLADRTPARLLEAMRYSLLGAGKRLRPILCIAFAEAVGRGTAPGRVTDDAACAIEYVHCYSLVHDDLPTMDDDDFRRGKATNHKVYGEAMAILAGDALLTEAFGVMLGGPEESRHLLARELALAAGASGMVGGQALDIAEDRPTDEGYIIRLHRLKTGALIRAACRMGALSAGGTSKQLEAAGVYGDCVGLAFQIIDDILDVTSDPMKLGKPTQRDAAKGRFTFPKVSGMPRSKTLANERVAMAINALQKIEPNPGPLTALARYSVERGA